MNKNIIPTFGDFNSSFNYLFRPGAYGIHISDDNHYLILKTPDGYFLPGGGVEKNETHIKALHRELKEETGYQLENSSFHLEAQQYFFSLKRGIHYLLHGRFYFIEIGEKVSPPVEPDHQVVWVPEAKVPEILFLESHRFAVKKAIETTTEVINPLF